ncbi:MAG TPA: hypothetical protein PK500_06785 [Candidatus Egerieousia sp.]|nr:hypothetical protein [Candidatus Egerieousia sp.]HPT06340.1 hypothetical protein [Candidatus Egerieousia sp.]
MKKLLDFIAAALFVLTVFTVKAPAQNNVNISSARKQKMQDSISVLKQVSKIEIIPLKSAWIVGMNPSGLVDIPVGNNTGFSYVESYFNYNKGGFVKYYESSNSNDYGFKTESYARVKKVAMHGLMEYSNFRGNNMTFSGVVDPERLTNFIADTVPAPKRQENYSVEGGIAFNATPWLAIGGSARFDASNMAKMRDLRHETSYAHIDVNFGAKYISDNAEVGASYFYRKYNESVKYSQVSDDNKIFTGYWFKGLFFNLHDAWDATNLYMEESQYFIDKYNGISGQVEFKFDDKAGGKWRFYNEFSFYKRRGQTGEGGEDLYSKSNGKTFTYTGKLSYDNGNFADYLTLTSEYGRIYNNDEVYGYETVNGLRRVVNYGEVQIFTKRSYDCNVDYRIAIGKGDRRKFNPSWDIDMGYDFSSRTSNSSFIQPYYYTQNLKFNDFYLKLGKNFMFEKGMVDIYAGGKWSHGWGNILDEHSAPGFKGTVATGEPVPYTYLLNREFEYYTANKGLYNCGLRYTAFLSGKVKGSLYFDASYTHLHGKDIVYAEGSNSGIFMARVGFNF